MQQQRAAASAAECAQPLRRALGAAGGSSVGPFAEAQRLAGALGAGEVREVKTGGCEGREGR